MFHVVDWPLLVLAITLFGLWAAAGLGAFLSKRLERPDPEVREELSIVQGATLTLLGLIIAFTFSMALNRYDQRKNYEEQEANAIGTEYVRADLLPAAAGAKVRGLLLSYLEQRILFYDTRDEQELERINSRTAGLQAELWAAILPAASAQPTQVIALAVGGMNDVLNSQGYTQAAWWNRIPEAAWIMLAAIAVCANVILGFGVGTVRRGSMLLFVVPLIVSITFFLIADIDAPRSGVIRVNPQNLQSLSESLHAAHR